MRRFGVWAAVALLALPLASPQEAQTEACRPPALSVQPLPKPLEPGASYALTFAIENPNGPPVDSVRATLTTTAPAGWAAAASPRELTLGPHNASFGVLDVTAPNRGSGAPSGNITFLVTFVCAHGEIQTSASSTSLIEVEIRQLQAPWPVILTAFVTLFAGVAALGFQRLRRGVGLHVSSPERPIEPGKSAKFTFVVENRRGKPQKLTLLAVGVPEGWSIHLALDALELEPGEEKILWAILKAPPGATPGTEADVQLRLESPRGARESLAARIRARVVAQT
jgi:hypothetical protein